MVAFPEAGSPVLVEPYFAQIACAGVLAAHQSKPDPANLQFVEKWLTWYSQRINTEASLSVYEGVRSQAGTMASEKKHRTDSLDSYAGLFLFVAGRWLELSGKAPSAALVQASRKMLAVLQQCQSPNGFYWNFPPASAPSGVVSTEYLLDNVEVYQGLSRAGRIFTKAGDAQTAAVTDALALSLANRMGQFWYPEESYYVCMYGDKAAKIPFGRQPLAAEGLSTTAALAFFDNMPAARRSALWSKFMTKHGPALRAGFEAADFRLEEPTIERVHLAALRAAPRPDLLSLQSSLNRRLDTLLARTAEIRVPAKRNDGRPFPYCHRYGLGIIALVSQSGSASPHLPSVPVSN